MSAQIRTEVFVQKATASLGILAVWKIPLIPSKEDFGGVMHKNFSFSEKSAHCKKRNCCLCLCRRCVSASAKCDYRLFCVLEKISPHSSKGKIEGCIGKNFLCFIKICALPKLRQALLCRRTGAHTPDNKTGASSFVWRCPLSLFNAAQFLRWVCRQKTLAIRTE